MTIRTRSAAVALVSLFAFFSAPAQSQAQSPHAAHFHATLSGAAEVPAVDTTGKGTMRATLNNERTMLKWKAEFSALSGPVTAAHFHGPATEGVNAGVVIPLSGSMDSPMSGEVKLTPEQAADLQAGKWYLNLHTAAHPNGEIRGQVMAKH